MLAKNGDVQNMYQDHSKHPRAETFEINQFKIWFSTHFCSSVFLNRAFKASNFSRPKPCF